MRAGDALVKPVAAYRVEREEMAQKTGSYLKSFLCRATNG